jgi:hypothetical protein
MEDNTSIFARNERYQFPAAVEKKAETPVAQVEKSNRRPMYSTATLSPTSMFRSHALHIIIQGSHHNQIPRSLFKTSLSSRLLFG